MTLEEVDLTDHERFAERVPHEMFAVLRREDPVHWQDEKDGRGFWAITRHADITAVAKDWRTFSSERGGSSLQDLEPEELEARKSMLDMDPPPHNKLRAIVNRDFTPRAVRTFTERIRGMFDTILDEALEKGEIEFVADVAAALPMRVFAELLGAPEGRPSLPRRARRPDARAGRPRVRASTRGDGGEPPPAVLEPRRAQDVRIRTQARGRAARVPPGRHRDQARRGRDRGLPADPARVRRLLPAPRRGRQRDDPALDLLRRPRPDREPGPTRAPALRARADAPRGQRDPALGDAGSPLPPDRHLRHGVRRQDRSARTTSSLPGTSPATSTKRYSTTPTRSTSGAIRTRR